MFYKPPRFRVAEVLDRQGIITYQVQKYDRGGPGNSYGWSTEKNGVFDDYEKAKAFHALCVETPHGTRVREVSSRTTPCSSSNWTPLTQYEIGEIMEKTHSYGTKLYEFAHAIEAKLKEKNIG